METKSVLLVDAFADEPLGGVSVPVVTDDVTRDQLRAVAGEFGADGAATYEEGELVYVARQESGGVVAGGVAGWTGLLEADAIEDSDGTLRVVSGEGDEQTYPIEADTERDVRVELPEMTVMESGVPSERMAPALGVTADSIDDVRDELPIGHVESFGGTLFVPVGFLEELSGCSPDRETLLSVLAETEAARVCAFTFDTLARRADIHVRVFDPAVADCERAASGVGVAGCGQYLANHEAFDGDIDWIRAECGHFFSRPGIVETTLAASPSVGGRALTVLDGTVSVPEESDDDIIEV
jgi:predicted PhzF superfamily epimerase YddE/YHI9